MQNEAAGTEYKKKMMYIKFLRALRALRTAPPALYPNKTANIIEAIVAKQAAKIIAEEEQAALGYCSIPIFEGMIIT